MSGWLEICGIDDIPVLGARVVRRATYGGTGTDIAIFRNGADRVFALLDRCPHKGGPLSQGIVHGDNVAYPLHGWNIELQAGSAVAPDHGCTQTFAVRLDQGRVYLDEKEVRSVVIQPLSV